MSGDSAFDLMRHLSSRAPEKFVLFERHLNAQLVRVLRTIGFDVDYARGEGAYLFDAEGNRYLDLLSGWGVFAVGRNHPTIAAALRQVLDAQLPGLVQMDVSLLAGILAEQLLQRLPWLSKLFFCNSGAEAVEAAIKFSRAATGRSRIVFCDHAFHGLTCGALSLNGEARFRRGFEPLLPDCVAIPYDDPEALATVLRGGDVAAVFIEPIQGKGVNIPSAGYLPAVQTLCRQHAALFVADEIQTGLGRTGRFIACQHWDVEPDMVLLAKALSGGFVPVGAVAMRRWIFDKVFDRMDRALVHGSTFSKNDMAMAAGLATLSVLDGERLIDQAAARGERLICGLRQRLLDCEFVTDVRGKGLMIAIELGPPRSLRLKAAHAVLEKAGAGLFCQLVLIALLRRHRILAQVAGHDLPVIKLLPPLVISDADVEWIETAFEKVLKESESLGEIWDLGRTLVSHALRNRPDVA
jgi:ornithine--oxo-acid transaminase